MAKAQKTVMVPEDLYRVAQKIEEATGASFTRTVTAALIQYLFQDACGPDPVWMRLAVALERGDVTVPELRRAAIEHEIKTAEMMLGVGLKVDEDERDRAFRINEGRVKMAQNDMRNYQNTAAYCEATGADPMERLLQTFGGPARTKTMYETVREQTERAHADRNSPDVSDTE